MMTDKLIGAVIAAVLVQTACLPVFAGGSNTNPIIISTSVDGTLTLTVAMRKNSPNGPLVPAMDFGILQSRGNSLVSSEAGSTGTGAIHMFISANSHGVPYTVTQTGTALSNGTTTLPAGACNVVPVYSANVNGGLPMPAGASLGTAGSWIAVNKTLYTSGPTGALRTFEAYYSITDDPAAGATGSVPLFQQAGNYSGTVTITATT